MKEQILQAMREFGAPVNAGKVAEITGIDRKRSGQGVRRVEERRSHCVARSLQVGACKVKTEK